MFGNNNDPESALQESDDESKMTKRLQMLAIGTCVLAVTRLLSLDIMLMISDLLTALMIYFYSQSKTKCMAIFCMFNGAIGIIYAVIKFFPAWGAAKENWFSLYHNILFIVAFYSLVVYSAICYCAYIGIMKYELFGFGMGGMAGQNTQSNGYPISSNYGAISNKENSNFVPFGGKGTALG